MWQTPILKTSLTASVLTLVILLSGCAAPEDQSVSSDQITPTGASTSASAALTQVKGKVTDAAGNPIVAAGVAVTKSSTGVPEILVLSNEKGEYVWELPAGEFTLTAHLDGYADESKDIALKEGQTLELNFQLEKQP